MTVRVPVVVAQVDAVGEVRVAAEVAPRRGTVGRRHCGAARRVSFPVPTALLRCEGGEKKDGRLR